MIACVALLMLVMASTVQAETFAWNYNTEPDMNNYRGERSDDGAAAATRTLGRRAKGLVLF